MTDTKKPRAKKPRTGYFIGRRRVTKEEFCEGWATPTKDGFSVKEYGDPVEPSEAGRAALAKA